MSLEKNEKNEKNEKLKKLFKTAQDVSTLYKYEKNLDTGREYITVNDEGYKKLCEFFYNQDNINELGITAYYIEKLNNLLTVNIEHMLVNGIEKTREHRYYTRINSDDIAYNVYKTVLDEM